jgi:hypothetical protein
MFNLSLYKGRGRSLLRNIPIAHLDEVKAFLKETTLSNTKYRVRYRGPRNTALDMCRGRNNRASTCLKVNAVRFSIYRE